MAKGICNDASDSSRYHTLNRAIMDAASLEELRDLLGKGAKPWNDGAENSINLAIRNYKDQKILPAVIDLLADNGGKALNSSTHDHSLEVARRLVPKELYPQIARTLTAKAGAAFAHDDPRAQLHHIPKDLESDAYIGVGDDASSVSSASSITAISDGITAARGAGSTSFAATHRSRGSIIAGREATSFSHVDAARSSTTSGSHSI